MKSLKIAILVLISQLAIFNADAQCPGLGSGKDSIKALQNYNLYRDAIRMKDLDGAAFFWRQIYNNNPGYRVTPFIDGEKIMKHRIKSTKDATVKQLYIDSLLAIFDKRMECHGDSVKVLNRKSVSFYQYRSKGKENVAACMQVFDEAIKVGCRKPNTLKYYFMAAVKAARQEVLTKEEALQIFLSTSAMIDEELAKGPSGKNIAKYIKSKEDIQKKLGSVIESCEDAKAILGPEYTKRPDDEGLWQLIYNVYAVQKGECIKDPVFIEVTEKLYVKDSTAKKALFLARHYGDKDKAKAEAYYNYAIASEEDANTRAQYLLDFARFYKEKGLFSKSRDKALEAAKLRPNWGEPYYLIGILYASSGKSCGPGTGWDSQVVTWPAIDMFVKAKKVDATYTTTVDPLISKYKANYPLKNDAFMLQLKDGDSYRVECWIQRNTVVRTQK